MRALIRHADSFRKGREDPLPGRQDVVYEKEDENVQYLVSGVGEELLYVGRCTLLHNLLTKCCSLAYSHVASH